MDIYDYADFNDPKVQLLTNARVHRIFVRNEDAYLFDRGSIDLYTSYNGFEIDDMGDTSDVCDEFNHDDLQRAVGTFTYIIRNKPSENESFKKFGHGMIIIQFCGEHRVVPFTNVNPKDVFRDTPALINDGKSSCGIFRISLDSTINIKDISYNKGMKETCDYIYKSEAMFGFNDDFYLYIIELAGGTLPIVLACKENIDENIADKIFEKPSEGFFNSYFEFHTFEIRNSKIYNNAIFGVPGEGAPVV